MQVKTKKQLDWALDKLNDVAIAAYGLMAGEMWLKVATIGITIPEGAKLSAFTVVLVVVWAIIGNLKGLLEEL